MAISGIAVYVISKKIVLLFTENVNLSLIASLFAAFIALILMKEGMETIVSLPFLTYTMYYTLKISRLSPKKSLIIGLLVTFTVLSRLDTALFFLIFLPFTVKFKDFSLKNNFAFAAGIIPFIFYILSNILIFNTLMPISGMVKQLKYGLYPEFAGIMASFYVSGSILMIGWLPLIIILFEILYLSLKFKKFSRSELALVIPSIIFPLVYLIQNVMFSGWTLWPWYFYIFFPAVISLSIFLNKSDINIRSGLVYVMCGLLIGWQIMFYATKQPEDYRIYKTAVKIKEFEKVHPGIYGMGDRAGFPGYLIGSPIIQLEGLMMNRQYFEDMQSMKLLPLLKKYQVDYYISNNARRIAPGKWYSSEPSTFFEEMPKSRDTLLCDPIDSLCLGNWRIHFFDLKE